MAKPTGRLIAFPHIFDVSPEIQVQLSRGETVRSNGEPKMRNKNQIQQRLALARAAVAKGRAKRGVPSTANPTQAESEAMGDELIRQNAGPGPTQAESEAMGDEQIRENGGDPDREREREKAAGAYGANDPKAVKAQQDEELGAAGKASRASDDVKAYRFDAFGNAIDLPDDEPLTPAQKTKLAKDYIAASKKGAEAIMADTHVRDKSGKLVPRKKADPNDDLAMSRLPFKPGSRRSPRGLI